MSCGPAGTSSHLLRGEGAADGARAGQRRRACGRSSRRRSRGDGRARSKASSGTNSKSGVPTAPVRAQRAEPFRHHGGAGMPAAEGQRRAARRRLRQQDRVAARVQRVQQRADVDLARHRPEPGHGGARRQGELRASTWRRKLGAPRRIAAGARGERRRAGRALRAFEVGRQRAEPPWPLACSPSQSLLVQVGTRYRDQDHDRASSQESHYRPRG